MNDSVLVVQLVCSGERGHLDGGKVPDIAGNKKAIVERVWRKFLLVVLV